MTYRLLLWFDMLEEEGKSTERVRGLFNRVPLLSKDLSTDYGTGGQANGRGSGLANASGNGNGKGISNNNYGNGSGGNGGNGFGYGWTKIMVVKI